MRSRRRIVWFGEAANLGELARDRRGLAADPLADGVADLSGQRGLELGRGRGERLDLVAGPLERGVDVARLRLAGGGVGEPLAGALDSLFVHESDDSVFVG